MNTSWFTQRRDVFIRDLVENFFEAKIYFNTIYGSYKKSKTIAFSIMDAWVGMESRKGPLWNMKDHSHQLFRSNQYPSSLYEHLLDWTIGSIFHEAMKLKEDAYQVESYKPLLELEINSEKYDLELSHIINEYFSLIEKVSVNLDEELKSIEALFAKALYHLEEILIAWKDNALLVRFLLERKTLCEQALGKKHLSHILERMFPNGLHEAYLLAIRDCITRGRYAEAESHLEKAVRAKPVNSIDKSVLQSLREAIQSGKTKEIDS